jgi:hypothetical protein
MIGSLSGKKKSEVYMRFKVRGFDGNLKKMTLISWN